MSYLDVPRLHFAGEFTADPSTINNTWQNYNPNLTAFPPTLETEKFLSWNPYGSHAWTIAAKVTSFVDAAGNLHLGGDPLIGAACGSNPNPPSPTKMVDLDTDQQSRTRLYGLEMQITAGGAILLQGLFDHASTLLNLWFGRVPTVKGDAAAGAAFQSVLEQLQWQAGTSPLLQQLASASPAGLSIRLNCYGYNDSQATPGFKHGSIVGTIGPWQPGEPRFNVIDRFLNLAAGSTLWYAPAKVDAGRSTATFDLGNSVPEQAPGGKPIDLGQMQAAVLLSGGPAILGDIDYSLAQLALTAGVAQLPLTAQQLQQVAGNPLAILTAGATALAESQDGLFVEVDGATLYMNPGDKRSATIHATTYGQPAAGYQAALSLTPNDGNNDPAGALVFPPSVTTDANGRAEIPLAASDPSPKPSHRQYIDGQLYFIGGPWASGADTATAVAPLTVKVFNSLQQVLNPVWSDVAPILFQFYFLYGYMASIVDLSQYDSVKKNASAIQGVLTLPESDPNYMPVTREMSRDQKQLILSWIAAGCPR
jgi:hypothetical protein